MIGSKNSGQTETANLIGCEVSLIPRSSHYSIEPPFHIPMSWKNPIDVFWTSSVEPRIFFLYFLVQVGMGIPWSALALMLTRDVV